MNDEITDDAIRQGRVSALPEFRAGKKDPGRKIIAAPLEAEI